MPELPEVETVKQALMPILENRRVLSAFVGRRNLRWPLPENLAKRLTNSVFTHLTRRGKYVLMQISAQIGAFMVFSGMDLTVDPSLELKKQY